MRRCLTIVACLGLAAGVVSIAPASAEPASVPPQGHRVLAGNEPLPDAVPEALAGLLGAQSLTLLTGDDAILRVWMTHTLPMAEVAPAGQLNYATVQTGAVLGLMHLLRPHIDYRDQIVPPGVFVVRYLQQPVDGAHIGVTAFRDFLVLTPLDTQTDGSVLAPEATLQAALQLNTHPYVWGLWPAAEVAVSEPPELVEVESDKWALAVRLPAADGSVHELAFVLVGSEPPDGYWN